MQQKFHATILTWQTNNKSVEYLDKCEIVLQSKDTYFHCEVFPVEYLSKIKDFDAISFEPKTAQFDALCKIL